MRISIFLFSLCILSFVSCIEDSLLVEANSDIDKELRVYFNIFENEAKLRGQDINLDNFELTGYIEEIHEANVAGICQYSSQNPNRITIDRTFWNNSSTANREMVVFHELGHCVLAQGHRETTDQNGFCLSIMRSGTGPCRTVYANNREYYLDELFFHQE